MKKTKYFAMFTFMLIFFAGISHADYHILIDHTCTDLSRIPATAISQAKSNLHIAYQHTSHGSQLITGMNALASYPDFGDTYAFSDNGISGLDLDDYGIPGGYHAYPYQGQIIFYDPEDIKAVQSGTRSPWQVLPYQVMSLEDISYMGDCTVIGAAAWDAENHRLFITEKEIDDPDYGIWGVTAVHVWQVQ
jgi:hypothetical protein